MEKSKLERGVEHGLFAARWLMAPFYMGLAVALGLLLLVFVQEIVEKAPHLLSASARVEDAIVLALSLIDICLIASLLLIVMYSGYETFVSHLEAARPEDRPDWMGRVGFSEQKMKLITSIVAISAVTLLKGFMRVADPEARGPADYDKLAWMMGLHVMFVVSGVLLAVMDWIRSRTTVPH